MFSLSSSIISSDTPTSPPPYVEGVLTNVPRRGRLHLANLPTPIHLVTNDDSRRTVAAGSKNGPGGGGGYGGDGGGTNNGREILSKLNDLNVSLYVKRDEATGGGELGGNKVRKLEFLLADALAGGCDSVVTIWGEQSNHGRVTAAAR